MQWDASADAGFGSAEPWLPFDPEWRACNVAAQRGAPSSLLEWYRSLIALRRAKAALRRGSLRFIEGPKGLLAWKRALTAEAFADGEGYASAEFQEPSSTAIEVFLNFRSSPLKIELDSPLEILMSNKRNPGVSVRSGSFILQASEALIGESPKP